MRVPRSCCDGLRCRWYGRSGRRSGPRTSATSCSSRCVPTPATPGGASAWRCPGPATPRSTSTARVDVMRRWLVPPLLAVQDVVADDVARPAVGGRRGAPHGEGGARGGRARRRAARRGALVGGPAGPGPAPAAARPGRLRGLGGDPGRRLDPGPAREVEGYVAAGYRRIKLKIQPGWDLDPVAAVRDRWPDVPLQVDANQAYRRADIEHLVRARRLRSAAGRAAIAGGRPARSRRLAARDGDPGVPGRVGRVASRRPRPPIATGAAEIVNIKPGRVGGYLEAVRHPRPVP